MGGPSVSSFYRGRSTDVEIDELVWLPANEAKLSHHGIDRVAVEGMIARGEWVVTTHEDYPDQVRVIGPTPDGRAVTVAMAPTGDPAAWRPVTGWDSTDGERAYYWDQYR